MNRVLRHWSRMVTVIVIAFVLAVASLGGIARAEGSHTYSISGYNKKDIVKDSDGNTVKGYAFCLDDKAKTPTASVTYTRVFLSEFDDTYIKYVDDLDITDAIPEMEEADGGIFLLEQLHSAIGEGEFIDKIQYGPHKRGDVLMLTGVGDVFPFMRVHSLLEALQPYFSDIPILVMYPGEFDGHYLKLFGRLTPNDYYRAFNIF